MDMPSNEASAGQLGLSPPSTQAAPAAIAYQEDGSRNVQFETHGELRRWAQQQLNSGTLPRWVDSVQKLETAYFYLKSLGLPVLPSLPKVYMVHGAMGMAVLLARALAERTGELEWCEVYFIDKDNKALDPRAPIGQVVAGCICELKRRGRPLTIRSFTLQEARDAKLTNNPVWTTYTRRMLEWRAMGYALRHEFAEALHGVALHGVDDDGEPGVIEHAASVEDAPAASAQAVTAQPRRRRGRKSNAERARLAVLAQANGAGDVQLPPLAQPEEVAQVPGDPVQN